jgi:hypothetical protein
MGKQMLCQEYAEAGLNMRLYLYRYAEIDEIDEGTGRSVASGDFHGGERPPKVYIEFVKAISRMYSGRRGRVNA